MCLGCDFMLHMAQVAFSHTAGHSNRCLLPCWGVGHVQLASWQLTVEVPSCSITPCRISLIHCQNIPKIAVVFLLSCDTFLKNSHSQQWQIHSGSCDCLTVKQILCLASWMRTCRSKKCCVRISSDLMHMWAVGEWRLNSWWNRWYQWDKIQLCWI